MSEALEFILVLIAVFAFATGVVYGVSYILSVIATIDDEEERDNELKIITASAIVWYGVLFLYGVMISS